MGVPGFFAWLLKNYDINKIINKNINDSIDILYLDANCLFHPQCFKILEKYNKLDDIKKLEKYMIKQILNYIELIINFVRPKGVYISVDGVAPMAKINQQRKRRFKTIYDKKIKNDIKKKYNIDDESIWTNIVITPGTEFMEKLHKELLKYTKKHNIKYSSYHECGEGEHKILQDIKKYNNNETIVIYGLDADLIFLALASNKNNIYLLRESSHINNNEYDDDLTYVSIDQMRICINKQIILTIGKKEVNIYDNIDFTNDFIFICYFLGNDFIPHIPSINIKIKGLDLLINCYVNTYNKLKYNLITVGDNGIIIDNKFLKILLNSIAKYEENFFVKMLPNYNAYSKKRKCNLNDDYNIEIWNLEHLKNIKINDPIKLGKNYSKLWKFRYYEHYFGVSKYQQDHINNMCFQFFKSIKWVSEYYFNNCCSWMWQYPYSHGPFVSDLSFFLNSNNLNLNNIKFNKSEPVTPFIQLLAVLPPSCSYILPKSYRFLMDSKNSPIIDIYPINISIDMINKDMYWKCIPIVPVVSTKYIEKIKEIIKDIKITKSDKIRNKIY